MTWLQDENGEWYDDGTWDAPASLPGGDYFPTEQPPPETPDTSDPWGLVPPETPSPYSNYDWNQPYTPDWGMLPPETPDQTDNPWGQPYNPAYGMLPPEQQNPYAATPWPTDGTPASPGAAPPGTTPPGTPPRRPYDANDISTWTPAQLQQAIARMAGQAQAGNAAGGAAAGGTSGGSTRTTMPSDPYAQIVGRDSALRDQALGLNQAQIAQQYGVDMARLQELARQFDITTAVGRDQFAQTIGLDRDKFDEMLFQFDDASARAWAGFDQQVAQDARDFIESGRRFDLTSAQGAQQFQDELDYKFALRQDQVNQYAESLGFQQQVQQDEFGLKAAQFNEATRQFDITSAAGQEQFAQTFGLNVAQFQQLANQFDLTQASQKEQFFATLSLQQSAQDWTQHIDTGRLNLDTSKLNESSRQFDIANATDLYKFAQTNGLDQAKIVEQAREFDLSSAAGRQQFVEQLAFDRERARASESIQQASLVLNAARGPADIWAYSSRLKGLQNAGLLGSILGNAITTQTGQSLAELQAAPILSNSQFALDMARASQGQPVSQGSLDFLQRTLGPKNPTASQQADLAASQSKQQAKAAPEQVVAAPMPAPMAAETPVATSAQKSGAAQSFLSTLGVTTPPVATGASPAGVVPGSGKGGGAGPGTSPVSAPGGPERLYAAGTAPALAGLGFKAQTPTENGIRQTAFTGGPGTAAASVDQLQGQQQGSAMAAQQAPPTGFQTSAQEWNQLDPTLQQMYMGWQSENGGQTQEDFLSGIVRGAPNFQRAAAAALG